MLRKIPLLVIMHSEIDHSLETDYLTGISEVIKVFPVSFCRLLFRHHSFPQMNASKLHNNKFCVSNKQVSTSIVYVFLSSIFNLSDLRLGSYICHVCQVQLHLFILPAPMYFYHVHSRYHLTINPNYLIVKKQVEYEMKLLHYFD